MLNNIKKVVVYDGENHLQNKDVIEHNEYKVFYGMANILYQNFVNDINQSDSFLYIAIINGKPFYSIKNAPRVLVERLKEAQLA
jgi:hypothetical protein